MRSEGPAISKGVAGSRSLFLGFVGSCLRGDPRRQCDRTATAIHGPQTGVYNDCAAIHGPLARHALLTQRSLLVKASQSRVDTISIHPSIHGRGVGGATARDPPPLFKLPSSTQEYRNAVTQVEREPRREVSCIEGERKGGSLKRPMFPLCEAKIFLLYTG